MTGISRATYYSTQVRDERQLARDLELRRIIEDIQADLPGYGYRRVADFIDRSRPIS
jgi:hypothetical protein